MAKVVVPLRANGGATLRETGSAALVEPGAEDCCCGEEECTCTSEVTSYLVEGTLTIPAFGCSQDFSQVITQEAEGVCAWEGFYPFTGPCIPGPIRIRLVGGLTDDPGTCGYELDISVTGLSGGYAIEDFQDGPDPTGVRPDQSGTSPTPFTYSNLEVS